MLRTASLSMTFLKLANKLNVLLERDSCKTNFDLFETCHYVQLLLVPAKHSCICCVILSTEVFRG